MAGVPTPQASEELKPTVSQEITEIIETSVQVTAVKGKVMAEKDANVDISGRIMTLPPGTSLEERTNTFTRVTESLKGHNIKITGVGGKVDAKEGSNVRVDSYLIDEERAPKPKDPQGEKIKAIFALAERYKSMGMTKNAEDLLKRYEDDLFAGISAAPATGKGPGLG